ncbi:MAG: deoxyribonuclease IV [bacterium]
MPDLPEGCLLGSHVSISGGIDKTPERAREIGETAAQIFISSNRQWKVRELKEGEADRFKDSVGVLPGGMHAHACYLINLAKPPGDQREKAINTLAKELRRCHELGIPHLVLHPGAHTGSGEDTGIERIQDSLNVLREREPDLDSMVLLETMAGSGSKLPYTFEQLAEMREGIEDPDRVAYCFDTCHVHASGYDLSTESSYEECMGQVEDILDLDLVKLLHLNDSKHEVGARKDRHEDIGEGTIGEEGFRCLMNDARWDDTPKILETPVEDDWKQDYGRNMETLISYVD